MDKVWLKGEYEFAALFSYRVPNFSPAYAPSAPLPGPSAVKLALVSTRIEVTGQVVEGERLFEVVKNAHIGLEPPPYLAVSRTFQRRLKQDSPSKRKAVSTGTCPQCGQPDRKLYSTDRGPQCSVCGLRLVQSFGIREYVHHGGPIGLYIEVADEAAALVADTMRRLRRIGTSDSLLRCIGVTETAPDPALIARPLEAFMTTLDPGLLTGRPVLPLRDIKAGTKFDKVNPYKKTSGDFTEQCLYIFPLRLEQQGEGWTRYRREAFQ